MSKPALMLISHLICKRSGNSVIGLSHLESAQHIILTKGKLEASLSNVSSHQDIRSLP